MAHDSPWLPSAHFAPRKSGGKMDVPLEAPACGIATQAVYAGVISSFLYGHLASIELRLLFDHSSLFLSPCCVIYYIHLHSSTFYFFDDTMEDTPGRVSVLADLDPKC